MSDPLVLVTGASGFVASHVTRQLQEEGWRVRATVRDAKNEKKVKPLNDLCPSAKFPLEIVEADLVDADSWVKAVEGCTYVIHVASPFPMNSPKTADQVVKPAVDGTVNVLKACAAAKCVKRVVVTSSFVTVASGMKTKESYNEEDFETEEGVKGHFYAQSKILAERAAWKFVEDLPEGEKFELATVHPGLIIGPVLHGQTGTSFDIMKQIMERAMPMVPRIAFVIADVRDVALAHVRCMTVPEAAGKRHIIGSEGKWFNEVAAILDKEFRPQGYNVPVKEIPGFLARVVKIFEKSVREGMRYFGDKLPFDNTRMRDVLQIQPTPADKSLIDMAYSMIEKGYIKKTAGYRGPGGGQTSAGSEK